MIRQTLQFLIVLLGITNSAMADLIAVSLRGIEGEYNKVGQTRTANFDLGVELVSIHSVLLHFSFEDIVAGGCLGCLMGTTLRVGIRDERRPGDPPPIFDSNINKVAVIAEEQTIRALLLFASAPVPIQPTDDGFELILNPAPLDVIGDGTGSVAVQLASAIGTIRSAQLIVEGTIVPEPSGILLAGISLFVFSGYLSARCRGRER